MGTGTCNNDKKGGGSNQPTTAVKLPQDAHLSEYQKELREWSKNVDKRYAWVALFTLWSIMAISLGTYRIYGLIYAKVTEEGVYNREDASWPISTIITVENIIGPLVSIIASHITFRISILLGFLCLAIGTGIGYLSNCLILDILGIGVVQGIGFAFIFMPFMSAVNEYFVKYRNVAFGVALSGGTISVFGWTPLFQWLIDKFYWRFSYLVICASCICGLLLVPLLRPNPRPKNPAMAEKSSQVSGRSRLSQISFRAFSYKSTLRRQASVVLNRPRNSVISINPTATTVGYERRISRPIAEDDGRQLNALRQQMSAPLPASSDYGNGDSISIYAQDNEPTETDMEVSRIMTILKTPGFHVIWIVELVYFWSFSIYNLMMVDYGVDKGCARDDAENLIIYLSIGELVGRLGLGALADMNYLSSRVTTALSLGILAAILCIITLVEGIFMMASLTTLISAFGSLIYILLNGLLVEYLGEQNVTIGYGMSSFITGLILFFRPYAVGYFRDYIGSYDPLAWSLGIFCALGSLLTFMEPQITRLVTGNKLDLDLEPA